MAINFSASFAACLAAGLKVPRQIMYCISQDTAPYVLYKDSQEAAERGSLGASGQWGTDMYPSIQQSPQQAHIANHHSAPQLPPPQQQHPAPNSPREERQQQQNETQHGANLPSPATSPYPQQTNANQDMDEDVSTINQVQHVFISLLRCSHHLIRFCHNWSEISVFESFSQLCYLELIFVERNSLIAKRNIIGKTSIRRTSAIIWNHISANESAI